MNKRSYLVSLLVMVILLAACGGGNDGKDSNNNSSSGKENKQERQNGFKEVETLSLESSLVTRNFSLNEAGDILVWMEQADPNTGEYPSRVWVDGEIRDVDIDKYGNTVLLPSGIIVTAHVDLDAPTDEMHTIIEYDPATDSEERYLVEGDVEAQLLHPGFGTYLEEPKTYVHTVTNPDDEGAETFILDVHSNTFTDVTIIQDIIEEAGGEELASFPHFFLSDDASMVYASVLNLGAFAYDIEKKELEPLVLDENFIEGTGNSSMLTADGKYYAYAINDSTDDELIATFHIVDIETKETIEIGQGRKLFNLTDGNIILIDGDDVNKFDLDTKELTTIHTIALEDNQKVDDVTVSPSGNTIAYGYTEKDGDDKQAFIKILSNK